MVVREREGIRRLVVEEGVITECTDRGRRLESIPLMRRRG